MWIVFGLIVVALVLFVTELIPNDMTAVGVLVSIVILHPFTGVNAREAIAGFASPATVTIMAMYILSAGIQKTGIVERIGVHLGAITQGKEGRLLSATVGSTGLAAGIINNTPVVAVFIPMITNLGKRFNISPSRLLLPLSYAAMLGGTLTLIGTSTNILASDMAEKLLGAPISMFEFSHLGLIVFAVGSLYLLTLGRWLIPDRIDPGEGLVEEFAIEDELVFLRVDKRSQVIGVPGRDLSDDVIERDLDLLEIYRDGESVQLITSDQKVNEGDLLLVCGAKSTIEQFRTDYDLSRSSRKPDHHAVEDRVGLVEVVVPHGSGFIGKTARELMLEETFDSTLLSIRREEQLIQVETDEEDLEEGDTLLLQSTPESIAYFSGQGDLVRVEGLEENAPENSETPVEEVAPLDPKTPLALGIMVGVIVTAAANLLPIVIAALAGVFLMVVTGCLTTAEAYESVSWNIIFLLAGVLPLGLAMQQTGGDVFLAEGLRMTSLVLPPSLVLFLTYLFTGLLASIITPVASVVLMIPVAVDTAARIGVSEYTFLIAVMFAASGAFMTPIGYQTNLMVYGPGGYKFLDYVRVGGILQLLHAVAATTGAILIFGL